MQTKKNIQIGSIIAAILAFVWEYVGNGKLCTSDTAMNRDCLHFLHDSELIVLPAVFFIFVFSLITYFMREEYFHAWWNIARWALPAIVSTSILVVYLVNSMGSRADVFDRGFASLFLVAIYISLILSSLWKIVRTHLQLKKAGN